MITFYR